MKYLVVIFMALVALFDGGFFFYFLDKDNLFVSLFGHLTFYLAFFFYANKFFLQHNYGVPVYLALFLPGVGGLLVALAHLGLLYFQRDGASLGSYEQYINYQRFFDLDKGINYEKEIKTISFMDQMNLLNAKTKKQLILEAAGEDCHQRVKVLQRGIVDYDKEVQHYSAVTLNMLENEYTQIIDKAREEFNQTRDSDSAKRLIKGYQSYLVSGLLTGDTFNSFNQDYIEALTNYMAMRKETPEFLKDLVTAHINAGDFQKAKELNIRLVEKFPSSNEAILNKAHIAFGEKNYQQIIKLVQELIDKEVSFPMEVKQRLDFWQSKREVI